jgi:phenylacetate-coenzyme A ligase PaaK-like adenylate-forming protein
MKYLIASILVILLVITPSCKFLKKMKLFRKKPDITAIWQAKQDSIRVADSIQQVQARLMAIENARLDSIRAVEQQVTLANKFRYNIIVGSFITPQYARDLVEVYKKRGYDPQILEVEGSRFELVAAEAYGNFRKAVKRLEQFQDTVEFEAWMYIRK